MKNASKVCKKTFLTSFLKNAVIVAKPANANRKFSEEKLKFFKYVAYRHQYGNYMFLSMLFF